MLVGTHSDLCTDTHIKAARKDILSRMHAEESAKMKVRVWVEV